jgi:hypothetical protein
MSARRFAACLRILAAARHAAAASVTGWPLMWSVAGMSFVRIWWSWRWASSALAASSSSLQEYAPSLAIVPGSGDSAGGSVPVGMISSPGAPWVALAGRPERARGVASFWAFGARRARLLFPPRPLHPQVGGRGGNRRKRELSCVAWQRPCQGRLFPLSLARCPLQRSRTF